MKCFFISSPQLLRHYMHYLFLRMIHQSQLWRWNQCFRHQLTLSNRKHCLNLAKISALAGRNVGCELKVKRIDADLNILQLQEEILRLIPDDEEKQSIEQNLLPPIDLIELCLKIQNWDLSLRVFDLFSWTSASFIRSSTSLLEECWRNAANQDDWGRLNQMSITEGWSDEMMFDRLKETVLSEAYNKCYGPHTETFDGRFDELFPLRVEGSEHLSLKDACSCVESVLMQHKDFPDAGKLMVTAVMLGSSGRNYDPME